MAILTVSRQFGSGGREIGRRVADDLGYAYVDRESILEGIRAAGEKWEKWGKGLDEHCPDDLGEVRLVLQGVWRPAAECGSESCGQ